MRRPWSLTVIGWLFLAGALFGVGTLAWLLAGSPVLERALAVVRMTPATAAVWSCAGIALSGLCGFGILGGREWARRLYLWAAPATIAARGAVHGIGVLETALPLANYAVVAWFLTRAPSRAFFAKGPHPILAPRPAEGSRSRAATRVRRWLSVPFFVVGQHLCFTFAFAAMGLVHEFGRRAIEATSMVLLAPGLGCLAVALALWGLPRWKGVTGAVLAVTGCEGLLLGASLQLLPYLPPEYLTAVDEPPDLDLMAGLGINLLILGVVVLPAGVLLILRQRACDRRGAGEAA